jgi:hypothetical protein
VRVRILCVGDMRRVLAILVFATAAGAAAAAGSGVYVAPHIDPPGTPLFHTHVLAAYRLPIFLDSLRMRLDPRQGLLSTQDLFSLALSGLVIALMSLLWPRLPRPDLVPVAELPRARIARALWRAPLILGPPKPVLL